MIGAATSVHSSIWITAFEEAGWCVRVLSLPRADAANRLSSFVRAWWCAVRLVRRSHRLVVQSMGFHGALALTVPSRRPMVVVPWGSEVTAAETSRPRRFVVKLLLRRSRMVITTSAAMARKLEVVGGRRDTRIVTQSWGVGDEFLDLPIAAEEQAQARARLGLTEDDVVVLAPRGTGPVYRGSLVQEAFDVARRTRSDLRLIEIDTGIAAGDPVTPQRRSGVTVVGRQSKHQLRVLYELADVVVSVPVSDQRSTSVLEAVFGGATILLADLPAYRELAAEGADVRILTGSLRDALIEELQRARKRDARVVAHNRAWILDRERGSACMSKIVALVERL